MQPLRPPMEVNAQTVAEYTSARQEMMERIKLRDAYIAVFVGAVAAVFGVSGKGGPETMDLILLTPYLSVLGLALNLNHTAVIEHLVGYLRANFPTGWDASEHWSLLKSQGEIDADRSRKYHRAVSFRLKILGTYAHGANILAGLYWGAKEISDGLASGWRWGAIDLPATLLVIGYCVGVVLTFILTAEFKEGKKYKDFVKRLHALPATERRGRLAILGASGNIGRALVEHFQLAGFEVIAVDKLITVRGPVPPRVRWLEQDCSDQAGLVRFLKLYEPSVIVNVAGYSPAELEVPTSKGADERVNELIEITRNIVEYTKARAEQRAGRKLRAHPQDSVHIPLQERVIVLHASSSLVYDESHMPHREEDFVATSWDHRDLGTCRYQWVHRRCEELLYAGNHGSFRKASLRLFNVAGAMPAAGIGEAKPIKEHIVPRLVAHARREIPVFERRTVTDQVRDYVHLADVCEAFTRTLDVMIESTEDDLELNICSGTGTSVSTVEARVAALCGAELRLEVPQDDGKRMGWDQDIRVGDITRCRDTLGWIPGRTLDEAIWSELQYQTRIC